MRRVVIAALVALASCGGNPAASQGSGIEGRITVGPSCPVQQAGSPCPDRPLVAEVRVLDASGRQVARFESIADGSFRLNLRPGRYTLVPRTPGGGSLPRAEPQTVLVAAGRYTRVEIAFDSGIR